MTTGGRRQLDDLRGGLLDWCAAHLPRVVECGIDEMRHPALGMSNETIIVQCGVDADGTPGPKFVVRLPPLHATFPDHHFTAQARVQRAVAGLGIPTAQPTIEEDPSFLGAPFIVMPFIEGDIPGPQSLFDPWLTGATEAQRRDAQREMARLLADIALTDWRSAALDTVLGCPDGSLTYQLNWWERYLDWAKDGQQLPRISALIQWCRDHRPPEDPPPSLIWGDARLGNLVMDPQRRVLAVLDWEQATIGPAEMDIAWYLGLEGVLCAITGKAPLMGSASAEEVAGDYQAALGRPLQDLAWHQIFAVFRALAIALRQQMIAHETGEKYMIPSGEKNPLLRVAENWIADYEAGRSEIHPVTS